MINIEAVQTHSRTKEFIMLDVPQQPAIVHECIVDGEITSMQQELKILDLSFYDVLAGGLCSGDASSRPGQDRIKLSTSERDS